MQSTIEERLRNWTENEYFDEDTRKQLLAIKDAKEIEDRFYCELEFGTGGMRGMLGAGTNRMNKYIIRKLTQGLADTIKEYGESASARGVVVAFDSRRQSREFAMETSLVLAANGIKAYLFEDLRPVPETSFAVRYLGTMAGVIITASHNPKEYNGYKVYWEDGGQIPPDQANTIAAKMKEKEGWIVDVYEEEQAVAEGLLVRIGEEVDRAYIDEVKKQLLFSELNKVKGESLKIVYSPLHGTGNMPVCRTLRESGFSSLFVVPEQKHPDTEFPTVKVPNPEDPEAFDIALSYAEEQGADIVLATDPDADRIGIYVKDKAGSYKHFTGNQIGVLLAYYLFSQKKRMGILPEDAVMVKTIASTDLGDAVAEEFGVRTVNVLVGFKYIGEQIKDMEQTGQGTYQFGFEESYGFLAGTYTRDKDAVVSSALLSEAALYYKEKEQKTLIDVLEEIYQRCGYYIDDQIAVTLEGKEGKERIAEIMKHLRGSKRSEIAGITLNSIDDYQSGVSTLLEEGIERKLELPCADVIRFSFKGGGFVMARPSGTEPKIRFYFSIKGNSHEEIKDTLKRVQDNFMGELKPFLEQ